MKFQKYIISIKLKDVFYIKIQNFNFFVFICKITRTVNEKDSRDIIFEVLTKSNILERLHVSDDFWKKFNVQDKSKKKQVGLYEIQNINNPNLVTIAINPKQYSNTILLIPNTILLIKNIKALKKTPHV